MPRGCWLIGQVFVPVPGVVVMILQHLAQARSALQNPGAGTPKLYMGMFTNGHLDGVELERRNSFLSSYFYPHVQLCTSKSICIYKNLDKTPKRPRERERERKEKKEQKARERESERARARAGEHPALLLMASPQTPNS